jgi:uncharacterized membrane protein YvlD (DUF360 family)
MIFSKKKYFSKIFGGIVFMIGDSIAALLAHNFSVVRALCVFLLGAILYAFEIQLFFNWIDRFIKRYKKQKTKKRMIKAAIVLLYFNPLWIARHLCLLLIFSGNFSQINFNILKVGLFSFLINIPISILANYYIQNKILLKDRFIASAIFSGLMAIYYSMSSQWF